MKGHTPLLFAPPVTSDTKMKSHFTIANEAIFSVTADFSTIDNDERLKELYVEDKDQEDELVPAKHYLPSIILSSPPLPLDVTPTVNLFGSRLCLLSLSSHKIWFALLDRSSRLLGRQPPCRRQRRHLRTSPPPRCNHTSALFSISAVVFVTVKCVPPFSMSPMMAFLPAPTPSLDPLLVSHGFLRDVQAWER